MLPEYGVQQSFKERIKILLEKHHTILSDDEPLWVKLSGESYENLASGLAGINKEISYIKSIQVCGKEYTLENFLGGDLEVSCSRLWH